MKSILIYVILFACTERVASLVTMGSQCIGEHCHAKQDQEERAVLYWLTGDSCFVVGKYNPFYEEEVPKFCPKGTELYWKDPKDWTREDKEALGLVEVNYDDLKEMNFV